MANIAIIGSRNFPENRFKEIYDVVADCIQRKDRIVTGGARGADTAAIIAVIKSDYCKNLTVYLPMQIADTAMQNRHYLLYILAHGGKIVAGIGNNASRQGVLAGIFTRNKKIVENVEKIYAFPSGIAKGTNFVCEYAKKLGKTVVIL